MGQPFYVEDIKTKRFRLRSQLRACQRQIDNHLESAVRLETEAAAIAKQIAELPSE